MDKRYVVLKDLDYGDLQDIIWDDIFTDEDAKNDFEFLLKNGFLRVIFPKGTVLKRTQVDDNGVYRIKDKKFDLYLENGDIRRVK